MCIRDSLDADDEEDDELEEAMEQMWRNAQYADVDAAPEFLHAPSVVPPPRATARSNQPRPIVASTVPASAPTSVPEPP
eukprot:7814036-Alexandrium_andersonii.AAC.1